MTLSDFLKSAGQSGAEFAASIGVSRQAISRYLQGRVPGRRVLDSILVATSGRVTPNDFFPKTNGSNGKKHHNGARRRRGRA